MKEMKDKQANAPDACKDFLRELAILRARVDTGAEQYSLGVKAHIDEKGRVKDQKRSQDLVDALTEPMQGND